jgi:hypothetical protein
VDVASQEPSRAWCPTAGKGPEHETANGTLRRFRKKNISVFLVSKGFLFGKPNGEGVRGKREMASGLTALALPEII